MNQKNSFLSCNCSWNHKYCCSAGTVTVFDDKKKKFVGCETLTKLKGIMMEIAIIWKQMALKEFSIKYVIQYLTKTKLFHIIIATKCINF